MGRRSSGVAKSGRNGMVVAAFSVGLLALMFLLVVPANAQDTSQPTAGATDPAGETASITESTTDPDEIVDRIVVAVGDCEVGPDASVVVEDDDGTQARLADGENVTITADADAVTIVGTGGGGNLRGIDASGGDDPQFGTEGRTVDGEIVRSTGITCGRDAGDDEGGDEGGPSQRQYGDDGDEREDLNCDDFDSQVAAQANLDSNPDDPNNLDADDDGKACEDFPYGQVMDDGDDEDLPETGGPPPTLFAGLCLLAALALAARSLTGRGA